MKLITALLILLSTQNILANPIIAYEEVKKDKAVLIDVREKEEASQGYIKLAHIIPLTEFHNHEDQVIEKIKKISTNKKIFLYCRSGRRSETAKVILSKNSIESTNLGGFEDLVQLGLPKVE